MAGQQRSLRQEVDSLVESYLSTLSPEDSNFYIPNIGAPNAEQKSNMLTLREQVKEYLLSKEGE